MKTRAMLKEKREMIRHLRIIFSALFLLTMYLPSQVHAGKITPTKTELGQNTTASGDYSTAMGYATTASGNYSTAMGVDTTASGDRATAIGSYITASGNRSTAMGHGHIAYSAYETVIGRFATEYIPVSTTGWNSSDRLFVIGNGNVSRSDAIVVLKNGNVGIGTSSPIGKLHIEAGGGEGLRVISSNGNSHFPHSSGWSYISGKGIIFRNGNNERMRLDSSGNVGIGTTSPSYKLEVNGSAGKPSGGSWSNSSDARLKDISGEYDRGLDQIISLKPVTFYYKEGNPRGLPTDEEYVGFVAQEARDVFPEAVSEGKDGYLDFNMHSVNVAVVNAIKELKAENEALKIENRALRQDIEQIKVALGL